ncbi:MAG TPA: MBOAT family O-acyltransferase [Terriglobales bacterium]|nr:MBOAT family O-acyltransferase [Terriglobales bacterium]
MLFNSYIFIFVFLPIVLVGWWSVRKNAPRLAFLTLASYVFYGWWDWRFLPLMWISTGVDWLAGQKIAASDDPGYRKRWLAVSMTFNLAILGFFKYYGFFASSVNEVALHMGKAEWIPTLNIILPIGISFYTFNSMSYTIDIYRRIVKPAKSFLHYSTFVALFPHLIAGPIVRYSDIEDQLNDLKTRLPWDEAATGIYFFVAGMAKKLLIADQLAGPVNAYFAAPAGQGAFPAWLGVLGYTFQIYFDFSAYSDMAVGLAHLLGIQFPMNFNSPYKAVNISDFWRRWHISLSTWLRDYLFIPLGGSRKGVARTALNLFITMFLGGLWHGANWTFVCWGLYHGVLLAGYHLLRDRGLVPKSEWASRAVTFLMVVFGWVFFRSATLTQAMGIFGEMFGRAGLGDLHLARVNGFYLGMILFSWAVANFAPNTWEIKFEPKPRYAYALAVLLVWTILLLQKESPFLYFQF